MYLSVKPFGPVSNCQKIPPTTIPKKIVTKSCKDMIASSVMCVMLLAFVNTHTIYLDHRGNRTAKNISY